MAAFWFRLNLLSLNLDLSSHTVNKHSSTVICASNKSSGLQWNHFCAVPTCQNKIQFFAFLATWKHRTVTLSNGDFAGWFLCYPTPFLHWKFKANPGRHRFFTLELVDHCVTQDTLNIDSWLYTHLATTEDHSPSVKQGQHTTMGDVTVPPNLWTKSVKNMVKVVLSGQGAAFLPTDAFVGALFDHGVVRENNLKNISITIPHNKRKRYL